MSKEPHPRLERNGALELENLPTDPRRVKAFAAFFKNYMSVSAVVVAALPIPATALGAIETFANDRRMLSLFTSLFCFLTLGFIFYQRHALARWLFPEFTVEEFVHPLELTHREALRLVRWGKRATMMLLPLILILLASLFAVSYLDMIEQGVREIVQGPDVKFSSREEVLSSGMLLSNRWTIEARKYYVGMFVCAEAAFILMATKEYLQDLLKVTDVEVMRGKRFSPRDSRPNET